MVFLKMVFWANTFENVSFFPNIESGYVSDCFSFVICQRTLWEVKTTKIWKKKKKKILAILEILEKADPDSTDSILDEIVSLIMTNITPNLAGTLLLVESFC